MGANHSRSDNRCSDNVTDGHVVTGQGGGNSAASAAANPHTVAQKPASEYITVRDYFAAHALIATIQRLGPIVKVDGTGPLYVLPDNPAVTREDGQQIRAAVAMLAYEYAAAMVAERAKGK